MSTEVLIDPSIECCSLNDQARVEAAKERWIRSQEAGRDMGVQIIRNWVDTHWRGFLRERWVEHLKGRRFWVELPREEFGLLNHQPFVDARHLCDEIIERVRCGAENLELVCWARTKSTDEQVSIYKILRLININAHRLRCSLEEEFT
jgi:hypothetical protein